VNVFDCQQSFQSDAGETETLWYHCLPETVLADWTHVGQ